jgi:LytS/YehU family sensor histidine kinase
LNSLIFENQQLASDFLQQLSKVYRYVLQHKEREVVALRTELEFLNHYILLLKTRFNEAIDFRIDIDDAEKEKQIVPLTLQILIENAIKHNIISNAQPLAISIVVDDMLLIVENNLNKKAQVESSNKHGLKNLKGFYQYLSDHHIEIIETEKLFTVKVPLI